jgi:hypothetical protein
MKFVIRKLDHLCNKVSPQLLCICLDLEFQYKPTRTRLQSSCAVNHPCDCL